jgi:hypothetical protein
MRTRTFLAALAASVGTTALLTVATLTLASTRGLDAPVVSPGERVAGFSLVTAAIVSILHAPVLALAGRTVRFAPGRVMAGVGGSIGVFAVFMLVPVAETGSMRPVAWTIAGWLNRPAEFAADWLPFLTGGAAFAVVACRRPRSRTGDGEDHERTT